ncbi:hypothetical protein VHEMI10572 [[Torrubiella] hemipterigena]|uniref:Uncharacterized protein n=1 Tax=[Torrubiella] hemipterigena TaxID=1531966 RepID=A0A0A1TJ08_9HYPO|nr:hypothetical protein VHEMI10572 [[Torrubiella] hemipterigena]
MPEDNPVEGNDLAEAYKVIARGEQTASALEANLTNLESKLDAILAAFESQTEAVSKAAESSNGSDNKSSATDTSNEKEDTEDASKGMDTAQ